MNRSSRPCKHKSRVAGPLLLCILSLVVASCGPEVIEGRPPFIGISGMQLVEDTLSADFRIANQNGVPMSIEALELTVTVDGAELTGENRELQLVIDANSSEEIHVREVPRQFTRDLLASLESHEIKSVAFDLQGRVLTLEDGYLRFEQKGHLYPVPGKPGFFRSAVTQAENLHREDQL